MSRTYIPQPVRQQAIARAKACCEYCQIPQNIAFFPHEIDHIIAEKHGGATDLDNLAYACWRCNRHKGSDLGSFDPETTQFTFFYNPRKQEWREHFRVAQNQIIGQTPIGRTTAKVLQFNTPDRRQERQLYSETLPN